MLIKKIPDFCLEGLFNKFLALPKSKQYTFSPFPHTGFDHFEDNLHYFRHSVKYGEVCKVVKRPMTAKNQSGVMKHLCLSYITQKYHDNDNSLLI